MEWFVCLTGEILDLEDLSKSLSSPKLCITKEGQDFVLKTEDFDSLKNAEEVLNKSSEILSLINGAAMLALGMRKSLSVTHVIKINDDGTRHVFIYASDTVNVRDGAAVAIVSEDGTVQKVHQVSPIPRWVVSASRDTNVAKVLRLFGTGTHDWVNLYRIYEVVESDVGSISNIVKKGWATEKAIERFKHTANSPGAIGDESRHGKQTSKAPKDPMTLAEAKSIIETLLHNWLRTKGE